MPLFGVTAPRWARLGNSGHSFLQNSNLCLQHWLVGSREWIFRRAKCEREAQTLLIPKSGILICNAHQSAPLPSTTLESCAIVNCHSGCPVFRRMIFDPVRYLRSTIILTVVQILETAEYKSLSVNRIDHRKNSSLSVTGSSLASLLVIVHAHRSNCYFSA